MTESLIGKVASELKSWKRSLRENEVLDWELRADYTTVTVCAVVFADNQPTDIKIKKHSFTLNMEELYLMEPSLIGGCIDKNIRRSLHEVREKKEVGDEMEN